MDSKLVLGVDVGGTASRALITSVDGTRVGYGRAGAGNPVAVTPEVASANVGEAITAALSDLDRDRVITGAGDHHRPGQARPLATRHAGRIRAVVVGAAGAAGSDIFQKLLPSLGIDCPLRVVGDVVVAFAAGTTAPSGTVLIAGTGAAAAHVDGFEEVRVADGLGWLLGDLGSGFWLGRMAASVTAKALSRRTKGFLIDAICGAIGESDPDRFVIAVHARPPRGLATLAPIVTEAALAGDPLALSIVDEAAGHLVATVAEVREPGAAEPIVLSGSVLAHSAPVRSRVAQRLAELWPAAEVTFAAPAETGAARLALRCLI